MASLGKFSTSVKRFAELSKENMIRVTRQSVQDVLELAQTSQPSAKERSGEAEQGKIPVDIGFLKNSLASGLDGVVGSPGPQSYTVAIAALEPGHVAHFEWTAEYALRIELGFFGEDSMGRTYSQSGVHFVGANAAKWNEIVEKNAALVKK